MRSISFSRINYTVADAHEASISIYTFFLLVEKEWRDKQIKTVSWYLIILGNVFTTCVFVSCERNIHARFSRLIMNFYKEKL